MGIVKIRLNTWSKEKNTELKFRRQVAPREGFVEICPKTKTLLLKNGEFKCKPWDTTISRRKDPYYIDYRKELYSGLCFENKAQAQNFMKKHKDELNALAQSNPLFDHWSIMNVIKRFEPKQKLVYGKDIKDE